MKIILLQVLLSFIFFSESNEIPLLIYFMNKIIQAKLK